MEEQKKSHLLRNSCFVLLFAAIIFIGGFGFLFSASIFGKENAGATGEPGDLANVTDIPDELKPVFNEAGKAHKVSPAFVAAIFWKEHGKTFPTKGPWASSPAGANGPFQFIEPTWEGWSSPYKRNRHFETDPVIINKYGGYGQDGNKDSKANVQNLYDAGFAAADLLGANGAAPNVSDINKLKDAASRYNSGKPWSQGQGIPETADYVPDVISAYQKFTKQIGGN